MRPMHAIALLPLGIRIVNQQDAIKIYGWIFEHDLAFDRANRQIRLLCVRFLKSRFHQGIERLLLRCEIRLRRTRHHLLRIPNLIGDCCERRLIITLEQPFLLQQIFRADACRTYNPQSYNPFFCHNFLLSITAFEWSPIHAFGGPRSVVAGRDRARPSRFLALFSSSIPPFQYSSKSPLRFFPARPRGGLL